MKVCSCCNRIYASEKDFLHRTTRWRMSDAGDLYFNCSCESTLVLPKGKHEWYNPTRFMSENAASIFNSFAGQTRFPLLSAVALEAQRLLAEDGTSQKAIVDAIKLDPLLSLRVIEMADISRPKTSSPIRTLLQAINILGRKRLGELVTISSTGRFAFATQSYQPGHYFQDMLMTGLLAQELAVMHGNTAMHDLAFVAGSLCNVGKLLGAICFPEDIDRVHRLTQQPGRCMTWREAEEECGAMGHLVLGEIAGALWGVSPEVLQCIAGHHAPPTGITHETPQHSYMLGEIVILANELGKYVLRQEYLSEPDIYGFCLDRFSLREADFGRLVITFRQQLLPKVQRSLGALLSGVHSSPAA